MQAQVQYCLGLRIGKTVTVFHHPKPVFQILGPGSTGATALEHCRNHARLPAAFHQRLFGSYAVAGGLDQPDDFINIGQGNGKAFQYMCPLARLAQFINSAACNHITAVADKGFQALLQVQQLGTAIDNRHHVDAEDILQLGMLVEIIQHNLCNFAALQVNDHAHAILVRLVTQTGNPLDLLVLDEFGNLFEHAGLVDLVRQLGKYNMLAALGIIFNMVTGTHIDTAAAGPVGRVYAAYTIDDSGGREIGAGYMLH